MANFFVNKTSRNIGTTPVQIGSYTANSTTEATVIGLALSNLLTGTIYCSVFLNDTSNANTYIIKNAPIPTGSTFVPIGGDQRFILGDGDSLYANASIATSIDATMSVIQIVT